MKKTYSYDVVSKSLYLPMDTLFLWRSKNVTLLSLWATLPKHLYPLDIYNT